MTGADYVILIVVFALLGLAVYFSWRRKKRGGGCCGSCGGCSCGCDRKDNRK